MAIFLDVLLAVVADIVAGLLLYLICKWLDSKDN